MISLIHPFLYQFQNMQLIVTFFYIKNGEKSWFSSLYSRVKWVCQSTFESEFQIGFLQECERKYILRFLPKFFLYIVQKKLLNSYPKCPWIFFSKYVYYICQQNAVLCQFHEKFIRNKWHTRVSAQGVHT